MNQNRQAPRSNPMEQRKRRREITTGSKNGPTPAKHRRPVFGSVDCPIHGATKELTRTMKADKKEIYTAAPATKREKYSGCPMCHAAHD